LRKIFIGLGDKSTPREDGFDITAASEVMAILCAINNEVSNFEELVPEPRLPGDVAEVYRLRNGKGKIGFVSSMKLRENASNLKDVSKES